MRDPSFASDNAAGCHPHVMEALVAANHGAALAYGADPWTEEATALIRESLGCPEAAVFLAFGGTGANVLALRILATRVDAALCASAAHLIGAETGSPQVVGGVQLLPVETVDGKMTPDAVRRALPARLGDHRPRPSVLSISNATELGTVYTPEEVRALADVAHELELRLHVDGARLMHAAAAQGCSLKALVGDAGVDAVSFGGTKNGMMMAEAVVIADPTLARDGGRHRKQITQLSSKMRFIAAQYVAMLRGGVWREVALEAHAMACRLAEGVADIPGVRVVAPVDTNGVFAELHPMILERLLQHYVFAVWDPRCHLVRWMTSHATGPAEVDALIEAVREASSQVLADAG